MNPLGLTVALVVAAPLTAQELSRDESDIVAWVDAHVDEAAALIERLVNINSGTMNHKGVRDVGDILRAELDALGFDTDWSDMSSVNRAGHVIASRDGDRGKKLVLIGHLDTVFEEADSFQRFERLPGTWATGPGLLGLAARGHRSPGTLIADLYHRGRRRGDLRSRTDPHGLLRRGPWRAVPELRFTSRSNGPPF